MNEHTSIVRKTPRATARKPRAAKPATLASLARSAGETGKAAAKAGARMSEPVMRSLQKEQPKTLAKMAVAALIPQLVGMGLRLALRNPARALVGVALLSAFAMSRDNEAKAG